MTAKSWSQMAMSAVGTCVLVVQVALAPAQPVTAGSRQIDRELASVLRSAGFTGRVEFTLQRRMGRRLDTDLVNLGRLLWFDTITGLNDDNTCAGCHSPTHGFGDTQSIAIGIENNGIVGPHRTGPRNMRRTPTVINSAFYPKLMWNSRFLAVSGDPFNNNAGFQFPSPEGLSLSGQPHLLAAQAFIPPTERTEVTGNDFVGDNDAIRAEVMKRLNSSDAYRTLFGNVFPGVKSGGPITYDMFAQAITEFEFSLTFANAPIDRFARGDHTALTEVEKKGALLFFGAAGCVVCHAVAGESNEMFSDFQDHVAAIPPIMPRVTNVKFDGPNADEDFGKEEVTGDVSDRYKFRTSPLRNVAVQSSFMHNGAFTTLEGAMRYHLNTLASARTYVPADQGLATDLTGPLPNFEAVLTHIDPLLAQPVWLTDEDFRALLAFVRNGLLDPRARPDYLRQLVPRSVPSGRAGLTFEFP